MSKRGNPTSAPMGRKVLSQNVVHPVAGPDNTDKGNPAKLRVPASKGKTLSQKVGSPVASRKINKTGAGGAC